MNFLFVQKTGCFFWYVRNILVRNLFVLLESTTTGHKFFDQPVKKEIRTHDNIKKITADQGDDYRTGSLNIYAYLNKNCKLIAINSKHNISARFRYFRYPKPMQQINKSKM